MNFRETCYEVMDWTGRGLCSVAGFGGSGFESYGFIPEFS
jgi:hypothetical protein